jgi:deazaflavin-dependent oxidoreductase (nitroreductase family)
MQMDEPRPDSLRQSFKLMNKTLMVPMWRTGLGPLINCWPDGFGRIMVLQHTGRRSGNTYLTPLNYAEVDGDVYCLAGFGQQADWYLNVMASPDVEIWLPDSWWCAHAEDASDDPRLLELYREVLIASGFAAPLLESIHPRTMSDGELADLVADYCLVRIRRTDPQTGPGGPGEYSWVWHITTLVLAGMLLLRPRRRPRRG